MLMTAQSLDLSIVIVINLTIEAILVLLPHGVKIIVYP